mmetsp:Transcript_35335/g.77250  ORF Transcript_35335/g.77250 Transcript_35335/m.77250 type:complete len:871 (-) Transcript_35335:51-2663(-)
MSTDPVLLGILGQKCRDELQLFERVTLITDGAGQVCLLCIGKLHIYFVSRDLEPLEGTKQVAYSSIERAVIDTSSRRYFVLEVQAGGRILIESMHRDLLVDRISLCWQTVSMFQNFEVKKFPLAKAPLAANLPSINKNNIDLLQVRPFKGYEEDFKHVGYSFFLRQGFVSSTGLKQGTWVHKQGWEVRYNQLPVTVPAGVQITVHVAAPVPCMELEGSSADDLRTVATAYKQALTEPLDQFYVIANQAYTKRMNRTTDIASWDGWEFFVRSKDFAFACILFRREYIPPLCDTVQDVSVLLRCPASGTRRSHDLNEVLLDECRFVADSLASTAESKVMYREFVQARLDTLQLNEDAYRWMEGNLNLTPVHKKPAAIKFVKAVVNIMIQDGLAIDEGVMDEEIFRDIPILNNPMLVPQELLSDAEAILGDSKNREERRNAWYCRVSRYLAFCIDGGIVGDRFSMGKLIQAVGKGSADSDKILKSVVEFLLHVVPRNDWSRSFTATRLPLSQMLQNPEEFGRYNFNERVMRMLLSENYIQNESARKRSNSSVTSYEKLLAALLASESVGIGLRTLICRQILEQHMGPGGGKEEDEEMKKVKVLVPALVTVMQGNNVSLTSCATAALVNLSCKSMATKNLLVAQGVMQLCIKQLRAKDDDLTLYTLYLLVNLTKTPHHRSIVVRHGGGPLLVDILTSSYQNLRKQKILTEVASVLGQLCNDAEIRSLISDEFPVVLCLLWVFDAAQPNTKLKSKLLFALRQLCVIPANKVKVGQHVIPTVLDELAQATPNVEECATNAILLLTMLANIHSNAAVMAAMITTSTREVPRYEDALEQCGLLVNGQRPKNKKYGDHLHEKVAVLQERIKESVNASGA